MITSSGGNGEFDFNGQGGAGGTTQNVDGMGTYNTNGQINFHDRQSTNVVITNGAVVAGVFNHNIDGGSTLTNDGTMSPGFPPGQANVNGNWQLGSTSNLSFEIEGTTQGTDYDVFATNGALTLNGNLVVRLLNGFTPGSRATRSQFLQPKRPFKGRSVTLPAAADWLPLMAMAPLLSPTVVKTTSCCPNSRRASLHRRSLPFRPALQSRTASRCSLVDLRSMALIRLK